MRLIGAMIQTFTTANTPFWKKLNFRAGMSPFWIMAPETTQRAALKKYRRSNSWSIVNRESLDIKN